jgi:hypothetical protein
MHLYAQDHRDALPISGWGNGMWNAHLVAGGYITVPDLTLTDGPLISSAPAGVFRCPDEPSKGTVPDQNLPYVLAVGPSQWWGAHYANNPFLMMDARHSYPVYAQFRIARLGEVPHPSECFMLADSGAYNPAHKMHYLGQMITKRHLNETTCIVFVDGHAEVMRWDDIPETGYTPQEGEYFYNPWRD